MAERNRRITSLMGLDYRTLGEHSVYPGHPITIAYLVTLAYENLDDALAPCIGSDGKELGWPDAVGNSAIPGAGGNAHSGVELLARLRRMSFEESVAMAHDMWKGCDSQFVKKPERWKAGHEQAERVLPLLIENLKTWPV